LLFIPGCTTVQKDIETTKVTDGQLTVFLKGPSKTTTDIIFVITSINAITEDDIQREIMTTPLTINSFDLSGRQMRLCEKTLPKGRYKKLHFTVNESLLKRGERKANLALPREDIQIDIHFEIQRNQNTSLFITWYPDSSIVDGYLFSPFFTVEKQIPELSSMLIYVTNEDSNNVSVINRQSGEVVATVKVGKNPRGIAASPGKEHPRIYVANSGSNSISVIDPTIHKVEVEIPIRFGREPESIAVAKISPDKEIVFITNYRSQNISLVDASTYQEVDKINVGDSPVAIAVDPPLTTLTGTRFLNFDSINLLRQYREKYFNVYVANRNSKNVSVIKMDVNTGRPDEVMEVDVQWSPIALTVDYQKGKVYVANYTYDNLSIIDILQLIKGNKIAAVNDITDVGTSLVGIIVDPEFDRLYLLKEYPGEISVIRPFSETFGAAQAIMSPLINTIAVGNTPRSFILDPEGRTIYVVNRGSDTVSVINKTTMREEKVIPVGQKPYGIAMFPF
jgi:YVTN family beta-propeller protein